jgi:radical SAM-linked protein
MAGRSRQPQGPPPPPVVARVRIRYAKRGRLRFSSHRDLARGFERALRRAEVPMAYSAGFSPHPRISYVGAAPTGAASEAEYLEIGLIEPVDLAELRTALDAALPAGFDIVEAVPAGPGSLAERIEASRWRIELPGVTTEALAAAVFRLLAANQALVTRMTKAGQREVDVRPAVVALRVSQSGKDPGRAIMNAVVRQVVPAVRPEDILTALRDVGGLVSTEAAPAVATRLAQGPLDDNGAVGDPLAADRAPESS